MMTIMTRHNPRFAAAVRAAWPDKANTILGIIRGTIDPESVPSVTAWLRQCYHRPSNDELKMAALDEVLETYGVEAIWSIHNELTPALTYCNAGDPYATTLLYMPATGKFRVGCYGDIVERRSDLR